MDEDLEYINDEDLEIDDVDFILQPMGMTQCPLCEAYMHHRMIFHYCGDLDLLLPRKDNILCPDDESILTIFTKLDTHEQIYFQQIKELPKWLKRKK